MKAYRLLPGTGIDGLNITEVIHHELAAHEVRISVRAVALNYRDLMVAGGSYATNAEDPIIPCSDGAGEVVAIGSAVSRVQVGDRVAASFFPQWWEGAVTAEKLRTGLGGNVDGMLAQEVTLNESALVKIPESLSFTAAATLPCAGVTAWNALFHSSAMQPGDTVLFLGTGGVSIMGLQLAKAAGLRTIITSSSDAKLERARALGADVTINYREQADWHFEVLQATAGKGVDLVLEVGGEGTVERSVAATAVGGTIAMIGGVSGFGTQIPATSLLLAAKRVAGVYVGSRSMLEEVSAAIQANGITPVIDRVFPFAQAAEAYRYMESGVHFGKIVIDVSA